MIVGLLQFEMLIHGSASLKDKRRVVLSIKDRLHREHQASVAEIGLQDNMSAARLGLALVGSDGRYVGQVLDRIMAKLRAWPDAELGDCTREVLHDPRGPDAGDAEPPRAREADHGLDDAFLARGLEALEDGPGTPRESADGPG